MPNYSWTGKSEVATSYVDLNYRWTEIRSGRLSDEFTMLSRIDHDMTPNGIENREVDGRPDGLRPAFPRPNFENPYGVVSESVHIDFHYANSGLAKPRHACKILRTSSRKISVRKCKIRARGNAARA